MADSFLRLPQVKALTGYNSDSHVYALIKAGKFPEPVKIGDRAVAWVRAEIEAWIASRIAASRPVKSESAGGDGSHPQNKAPLPASRRQARAVGEASHE